MDATGWRWSNNLDTYGFITAPPGHQVYVASGAENRTYRATVQADGTLGDLEAFAERGGESAAADTAGNVYVANGQIFVYDRDGTAIGQIDVPERPTPGSVRRIRSAHALHRGAPHALRAEDARSGRAVRLGQVAQVVQPIAPRVTRSSAPRPGRYALLAMPVRQWPGRQ